MTEAVSSPAVPFLDPVCWRRDHNYKKLKKVAVQRGNENLRGENHAGEIPYLINFKWIIS